MSRTGAVLFSAFILVALAGQEAPKAAAVGRFPFQVLLNADGSGRIFMNDGRSPSWNVCKPGPTDCQPFATGNFTTGNAPAESVFWAGEDLVTPLWKGEPALGRAPDGAGQARGK